MAYERTSQQMLFGTSALLFTASAVLTTVWCGSMSAMEGMPMPGGWTMSLAWMPMAGQTWLEAAASFVGMWIVMMVAMMLPSLAPTLFRHHQALRKAGEVRRSGLTGLVAAGYFLVWAVFGMIVFPVAAVLAEVEMQQPALARFVPLAVGVVVVAAGGFQFSRWKTNHLACCRETSEKADAFSADAGAAWRYGLSLGLHCTYGCAGFTAILLVVGVMDLGVMALVTAAITAERLAPNGERVAQAIGIVAIAAGLLLIARAAGGLR